MTLGQALDPRPLTPPTEVQARATGRSVKEQHNLGPQVKTNRMTNCSPMVSETGMARVWGQEIGKLGWQLK